MIDEDSPSALDHPVHAAVERSHLDHTLDHLNRAPLLVDDHREGRAFDHRGQHGRVDGEVGNARVLHLEQQGAEVLDHAREAGRLGRRRKPELAPRSDDDIVAPPDESGSSGRPGEQGVTRSELATHLQRGRLKPRMDDSRIAAELGHDPFVLTCPGRACRCGNRAEEQQDDQG